MSAKEVLNPQELGKVGLNGIVVFIVVFLYNAFNDKADSNTTEIVTLLRDTSDLKIQVDFLRNEQLPEMKGILNEVKTKTEDRFKASDFKREKELLLSDFERSYERLEREVKSIQSEMDRRFKILEKVVLNE